MEVRGRNRISIFFHGICSPLPFFLLSHFEKSPFLCEVYPTNLAHFQVLILGACASG